MRTMIATMLLPLLALVGVELFTRTTNVAATPVATVSGTASCRIDGTGRLRLIEGETETVLAEPHQIDLAKNGGLTAYATLLPTGFNLFVCSEAGNILHQTSIPNSELEAANSLSKVKLLSATRAFVELHVNPSTDLGLLIDLRTGQRHAFEGHDFSLSADGQHVAYFQEPPHGFPAGTTEQAGVYVDDRRLADVPRDSGNSLHWKAGRAITASVKAWNGTEETYELKPF